MPGKWKSTGKWIPKMSRSNTKTLFLGWYQLVNFCERIAHLNHSTILTPFVCYINMLTIFDHCS